MANLPNLQAIVDGYVAGQRAKLDRARKANVKIVFGSDMWFGYAQRTRGQATRLVLESMQASFGMPAADVLRSATVSAADLLNSPGVTGTIEAKSFADLIAVDGDPLANVADLEKIVLVMKGGAVIRDEAKGRAQPQS
jgi:imidazolonepropionase-like amidohydrolase